MDLNDIKVVTVPANKVPPARPRQSRAAGVSKGPVGYTEPKEDTDSDTGDDLSLSIHELTLFKLIQEAKARVVTPSKPKRVKRGEDKQ